MLLSILSLTVVPALWVAWFKLSNMLDQAEEQDVADGIA